MASPELRCGLNPNRSGNGSFLAIAFIRGLEKRILTQRAENCTDCLKVNLICSETTESGFISFRFAFMLFIWSFSVWRRWVRFSVTAGSNG